jgi:hypothetical protein
MRSTVRIEDDLMEELRRRAQREKSSLTRTLNGAVRAGLRALSGSKERRTYREKPVAMGTPSVALDKALALAGQMEDEEVLRELATRK